MTTNPRREAMEPATALVQRALREPTLHFTFLAGLLFLAGAAARSCNRPVVEIDPRSVELRIRQLERGRGSSLREAERRRAEEAYIDEQILAREARARGLDDDEKIRAILYQKMLHVLSGEVREPTEDELRQHLETHRARYAARPAVTVEDVVGPGGRVRQTVLTRVTEGELAWSFGEETAARVFQAETGRWVGPHESAEGEHWFRVIDRFPGADAPPLEAIREQVRFDWMAQREEALLAARVAELRQRYRVQFKGAVSPSAGRAERVPAAVRTENKFGQ
jgi:hypothetical protein